MNPGLPPLIRIDYIWHSRGFQAVNAEVARIWVPTTSSPATLRYG